MTKKVTAEQNDLEEEDVVTEAETANNNNTFAAENEDEDPGKKAGASWYVIHTYSGYENKVCKDITKRITSMEMEGNIFQVLVPVEEERDITKGSKVKVVEKKVYPGYVLIQMLMSDQAWYVVRNTPGVTGFVSPGSGTGTKPVPLPEDEVLKIKQLMGLETTPKVKVELEVGQAVSITHGALQGNHATVVEVDPVREKVKVLVSMFGREIPADVDISQVEKLS